MAGTGARLPCRSVSTALSNVVGLVALLLAVAAIVLATIANRRLVRRPAGHPREGADEHGRALAALDDRIEQLAQTVRELGGGLAEAQAPVTDARTGLAALREPVDRLGAELDALRTRVEQGSGDSTAMRHVAVVRYDAFADVGGRLSYSLAVLDDTRSGFVLTTLAGKSEVRTYVRTISAGRADGTLTAEEQQAIEAALPRAGSRP